MYSDTNTRNEIKEIKIFTQFFYEGILEAKPYFDCRKEDNVTKK